MPDDYTCSLYTTFVLKLDLATGYVDHAWANTLGLVRALKAEPSCDIISLTQHQARLLDGHARAGRPGWAGLSH